MTGEEIRIKSSVRLVWDEGGLTFEWNGGPHINVRTYHDGMPGEEVLDIINVYDHERGAVSISTIGEAQCAVIEWITDNQEYARQAGE